MAGTEKGDSWESYVPERLREDLRKLPQGLVDHCERIGEVSRAIARRHGYDPEKARATALVHDIARAMSDAELRQLARQCGLRPNAVERDLPILLHGPVGAELLRRSYCLTDKEMLQAVACHTTGRPKMGLLDSILFLADKLDPDKVALRPELAEVRDLAEGDIEAASLRFFDLQLSALILGKQPIHPAMVAARNELLERHTTKDVKRGIMPLA